jgi:hypothetical protein
MPIQENKVVISYAWIFDKYQIIFFFLLQREKLYDFIGSTFGNLNKLAASSAYKDINSAEFLTQFKCELQSLENKISEVVTSMAQSNNATGTTSLTNL